MTKDEIVDAIDIYLQNKHTWISLTDEEHMQLAEEWGCMSADWVFYVAAIERKVRQKNEQR